MFHLISLLLDNSSSSSKTDHCTQSEVIKLDLSHLTQCNSVKRISDNQADLEYIKGLISLIFQWRLDC